MVKKKTSVDFVASFEKLLQQTYRIVNQLDKYGELVRVGLVVFVPFAIHKRGNNLFTLELL